ALVNTIESAMNVIWRVTSELSIMAKLTRFWAVITLGPVLIGVSIYWTAQMRALTSENTVIAESAIWSLLNVIIPIAVTWLALLILYVTMPSAKVRLRDAALGSLIAAALFELVKSGFAHYLTMTSTYSKLYGILASIPLFLLWLYIAWVVVLYGAQITYEAGAIVFRSGRRRYATDLGEIGAILGLRILHFIGKNFMDGNEPPSESEIAIEIGTDPVLVRTVLDLLTDARIITTGDNERHSRTLCVAPSKLKLSDIANTFMSKEYLKKNGDKKPSEGTFLQAFYLASKASEPDSTPTSWTLADFIMLS
ncbi:MAG: YihY family inner membrane protein, partial [Bdellovibrionales bacterium]|nr:YihY family inner membrane protein [Bdellovibrionales bacterium]